MHQFEGKTRACIKLASKGLKLLILLKMTLEYYTYTVHVVHRKHSKEIF